MVEFEDVEDLREQQALLPADKDDWVETGLWKMSV